MSGDSSRLGRGGERLHPSGSRRFDLEVPEGVGCRLATSPHLLGSVAIRATCTAKEKAINSQCGRALAVAASLAILGFSLNRGIVAAVRQPAASGSAIITVHVSGALNATATLHGPSSVCQLAYFPAATGTNATAASSILLIAHNAGGVSRRPPAADAFALELVDYTSAAQTYTNTALLSLVVQHHSYLFSIIDSTSMTVRTQDGGRTGTFKGVGLKPNNSTRGGRVNASGSWICAGFQKETV